MEAGSLSTALTSVGTIVTQAIGIITGNDILMVMFAGGLLGIGFRAIRQARRAVTRG